MFRKNNVLDDTTFEFLKPGWLAIHVIAAAFLITALGCSYNFKRKYLS